MDTTKMEISLVNKKEEIPYDLLLLSDDTQEAIDKNLDKGELYIGKQNGEIVASFILKIIHEDSVEIKNIAVIESLQGKGVGTTLLHYIKNNVAKRGFKQLIVGTCDQCEKEIEFYKKSGFVISGIRKNFFLDHYTQAIFENGKQIVDMVVLKIDL